MSRGLTVLHGGNAQGKSNLLEAVYLLAIGKSYRAPSERDLVSWEAAEAGGYAIAAGTVHRHDGRYQLRIGLDCANPATGVQGGSAQKRVRVNGVPKRASELIGVLNAVLFSAEDIDLVFGPPAGRRRYLDVLLSQITRRYVQTLQRYQRVLTQRNSLLKGLKEGRVKEDELDFWDRELCELGGSILAARYEAMERLAPLASNAFLRLSGIAIGLSVGYVATAPLERCAAADAMVAALKRTREKERAMAMTVVGPHRDDLRLTLGGVEMTRHASRGQARLAALALRLAEGELMREQRGDPPVLLLDDILSELDETRRSLVLEEASRYAQTLVTTADLGLVPAERLDKAHCLRIESGEVLEEAPA